MTWPISSLTSSLVRKSAMVAAPMPVVPADPAAGVEAAGVLDPGEQPAIARASASAAEMRIIRFFPQVGAPSLSRSLTRILVYNPPPHRRVTCETRGWNVLGVAYRKLLTCGEVSAPARPFRGARKGRRQAGEPPVSVIRRACEGEGRDKHTYEATDLGCGRRDPDRPDTGGLRDDPEGRRSRNLVAR